ncbi:MAG: RNA-protein complex protein Nop10 [Thermoplasmata archaeon]|nr:MAG: RNA-protein complex protein Nop10 [Thermoplasmata archaeon]KAA0012397.1 MAG: RNA-protein complex protein Nop10 [Thermoplasmata archaeon]
MKYCYKCKRYTLHDECPICGEKTARKEPPRFSPQDKYGKYRRMLKKEETKWKKFA